MPTSPGLELKALMQAAPALTLAVAESLTCGHLQARVGGVTGASTFLLGGLTAYTLEQKVRHLGLDRATAEPVNAVSAEVARQMARGVCRLFGSAIGLATTGYAESPPPTEGDAPFAWWALAHHQSGGAWIERQGRIICPGRPSRLDVQTMVADAVLGELLQYLRGGRT